MEGVLWAPIQDTQLKGTPPSKYNCTKIWLSIKILFILSQVLLHIAKSHSIGNDKFILRTSSNKQFLQSKIFFLPCFESTWQDFSCVSHLFHFRIIKYLRSSSMKEQGHIMFEQLRVITQQNILAIFIFINRQRVKIFDILALILNLPFKEFSVISCLKKSNTVL